MNWKWLVVGFLAYRALKSDGSTWIDRSIYEPPVSIERRSTALVSGEMSGDVSST
jgi:hypothetical protein